MNTIETQNTKRTQGGQRERNSARPNFLFILADDLGYADLHCYGGRENCSPNLDRMATEGLRFTNGYANSVGLLAVALCDRHGTLSAPAARRF